MQDWQNQGLSPLMNRIRLLEQKKRTFFYHQWN